MVKDVLYNKRTILSWIAVFIWMFLIFSLSSQVAGKSSGLSNRVTQIIIEIMERLMPNNNFSMETFSHIVRKSAHFFAYLILGVLVLNALRSSKLYGPRYITLAILICIIYAISDEVHQLYVPGRSGEVRDVLIDSAGAITGIGIYLYISKIKKNLKRY